MKTMTTYTGLFLDKKGNVLTSFNHAAYSIKEAKIIFAKLQAESMLNDLHKIKVVKA